MIGDSKLLELVAEQGLLELGLLLDVALALALHKLVQRRLGDVDVPGLDQLLHLAEQEREDQGPDVGAVDVRVGVVSRDAAHAGDEVLVGLDREVVDLSADRLHLLDARDGQRHQVAADRLEAAVGGRATCGQAGGERGTVGMIAPHRLDRREILRRADRDGPCRRARHARRAANLADDAVRLAAADRRDDAERRQQLGHAARDVPRRRAEARRTAAHGAVAEQQPAQERQPQLGAAR